MTDEKHEIVIDAPKQMRPVRVGTHPLVAAAMQNPSAIDTQSMRELLKLQREWEAGEAKRAFDADKINLMAEMPTVISKDRNVDFGKTKFRFASLAHILEEVEPFLAKHGFSKSWKTKNENGMVHVTCTLTHALGHSIDTTLAAAPDTSGSKNPVQSVGSTVEYLKRYTLNCLLGITTRDELDADETAQGDRIDIRRNLQAVARLQTVGISLEKAQEFTGRTVQEWTKSDLDDLFDLYKQLKSEQKAQETNPGVYTATKEDIESAASKKWPKQWGYVVNNLAETNGIDWDSATPEQLGQLLGIINGEREPGEDE